MLGKQHVFLAQFTLVADQLEAEAVFVRAAKLVNAGTPAVFRDCNCSACFLNRDCVPGDRVSAPDIAFPIMIWVDVECTVCLDCPDRAERVSPRSNEWPRRGR